MDTAALVVKFIGDAILPLLGITIGFCAVSPALSLRIKRTERRMRKHPWIRGLFGVVLILFSGAYLIASVRTQLKQTRESGLVYQQQIVLKSHIKALAKDISISADDWSKIPMPTGYTMEFYNKFADRLNKLLGELNDEGVNTSKIYQLDHQGGLHGNGVDPDTMRAIAVELEKDADQLPSSD